MATGITLGGDSGRMWRHRLWGFHPPQYPQQKRVGKTAFLRGTEKVEKRQEEVLPPLNGLQQT